MIAWVYEAAVAGVVTGRSLHGRLFQTLSERAPTLAGRIHRRDKLRPFTWAVLPSPGPGRALLRLSVMGPLEAELAGGPLWSAGTTIDLDGRPVTIERALGPGEHEWAGATTFAALSAGAAAAAGPVVVEFATPTAFRAGDADSRTPDPRLIVQSWRQTWREFADAAEPAPMSEDEVGRVSFLSGQVRTVSDDASALATGFMGMVSLAPDAGMSPAGAAGLHALAAFAFYCGTGKKRAMGMGLTRAAAGK
jgi:CRISPR-associated endoribonuclease Cas6